MLGFFLILTTLFNCTLHVFGAGVTQIFLFFFQNIHSGPGAHPASFSMAAAVSFPWGKAAGARD
jgi:hypothetical protein